MSSPSQGKFVCSSCNKGINNRRNYATHYRKCVLGDEFPFKCILCGAAFKRKQLLTNHRRTCDGTAPPPPPTGSPSKKPALSTTVVSDDKDDDDDDNDEIAFVEDMAEEDDTAVTENSCEASTSRGCARKTPSPEIPLQPPIEQPQVVDNVDDQIEYTPSWERGKELWKALRDASDLVKDYFIYFLVDPTVESMREGIFFVGKGCYSCFDGPFTDAIEWFLDIDETMRSSQDPTRQFANASPKVKNIWYIWNADRGVGLVTPIQLLDQHEAEVFEACLIDELGAQLANENWGTLHGIANEWTQDQKRDVAEFVLDLSDIIVSRVDLQLLFLRDVKN